MTTIKSGNYIFIDSLLVLLAQPPETGDMDYKLSCLIFSGDGADATLRPSEPHSDNIPAVCACVAAQLIFGGER